MTFNSIEFIIFALIFFLVYFNVHGNSRLFVCLVASFFFYAWWDWRFLSLLAISSVTDYIIGILLNRPENTGKRKFYLSLSISVNLGILCIFKYFDFFIESFQSLLSTIGFNASFPFLNLILPVGISFYTFQTLSYTIDVYRGECDTEYNFLRFI